MENRIQKSVKASQPQATVAEIDRFKLDLDGKTKLFLDQQKRYIEDPSKSSPIPDIQPVSDLLVRMHDYTEEHDFTPVLDAKMKRLQQEADDLQQRVLNHDIPKFTVGLGHTYPLSKKLIYSV